MSFIQRPLRRKQGLRRYIGPKRVILLLGLAAFTFLAWYYYRAGSLSPAVIEQYHRDNPALAVLLFMLIYGITVIASLPSLPLNLAAGFFWGGLLGGVYSALAVTIGGWAAFTAARWLIGQPLAASFDTQWAGRVQREFNRGGWKFVAFARINPIIPTGPLNYLLGLTSLSHKEFLLATFVFLLPPSIAVACIGDTLQTFAVQRAGVSDIVRGILIFSAAVTFLAGLKFASGIYRKRVEK
jgi:uncharacterized membrane protein YdjX (TVP38/TMEM64 family)